MGVDVDPEDAAEPVLAALVEELMKKSGLCWVRPDGQDRDHPVWHVWQDGAAYVVSGGSEQPLPGAGTATAATVISRTKDSRQRLLAWRAEVAAVSPDGPEWDGVVRALVGARLNLRDLDDAAGRWARESVVTRLAPTGEIVERPDEPVRDDLAAPPLPSPAVTRRRLPRVLHRRQNRPPDLRTR